MTSTTNASAVIRKFIHRVALAAPVAVLCLCTAINPAPANGQRAALNAEIAPEIRNRVIQSLGQIPLTFEANEGQFTEPVEFAARGPGYDIFLTADETVFSLSHLNPASGDTVTTKNPVTPQTDPITITMKLAGAGRPSAIVPEQKQSWRTNYFIGRDRSKWRTGVPAYARVRYEEVYPGIDVEYYGSQKRLEYDFIIAPGVDPGVIALSFEGTEGLSVDKDGNLILHVPGGKLVQHAPVIYQEADGKREPVTGHYALREDGKVGFQLAAYDTTRPLIIDPVLEYSTLLATYGEYYAGEKGMAIAVDNEGAAYVAMTSNSIRFPVTVNEDISFTWTYGFVVKLSPDGSSLEYITYITGARGSLFLDIAVDEAGAAYVAGSTISDDFPITPGAFQEIRARPNTFVSDAVFTKLDPTGSNLLYSTFIGGNWVDEAKSLAVDAAGTAYIAGSSRSTDFPVTIGTPTSTWQTDESIFIAKFDASGPGLIYSRTLGGQGSERAEHVAVDSTGATYITGITTSPDFPVTAGAAQTAIGGNADAFVVKLDASGNNIIYGTFLGGVGRDIGLGLAIDAAGAAYVSGGSESHNFPVTPGAFYSFFSSHERGFVTKIDPTGSSFEYSTGLGLAVPKAIAVDADNSAYVAGSTSGSGGLAEETPDAFYTEGAWSTVFMAHLNPSGTGLIFGTYLSDGFNNFGHDLALDSRGAVYVTGYTGNLQFPTTPGAYHTEKWPNNIDGFVVKIAPDNQPPVADAGPDQIVGAASAAGASVTLDGSASSDPDGDPLTYTWSGPFGSASGASPTVTIPLGVHVVTLEVSDGTAGATDTVQVTVQDTTPPVVTPPADITAEAEGPLTNVNLGTATAADLVDGALTPTPDQTGPFALGTHTITWSATDAAGNTGTATQQVTVQDTTPPVITPPADITVEAQGPLTTVSLGTATAADLVDGVLTATPDQTGPFAVGIHTITWSVTDAAGNTGTATQTITVQDTTAPVVTPPADITATVEGPLTEVSLGTATAVDLVDGTLTATPDQTGPFAPGTYTITWSATDAAGNVGTATQKVSVLYDFDGFHAPVKNLPDINSANAGRTVPVKWSIPLPDGSYFTDLSAVVALQMTPTNCDCTVVPENFIDVEGTGQNGLHVSGNQFVFNWDTTPDLAGNCFLFILVLNDGTIHTARFNMK